MGTEHSALASPLDAVNVIATDLAKSPDTFLANFVRVAERHAARTAVVFEDQVWSYRDLELAANRIANWLQQYQASAGEERSQFIGLCLDRSATAIATMIGVMSAGAAFVPLDPDYPAERLRLMVEDAGIQLILCDPKYADLFRESGATLVQPDDTSIAAAGEHPPLGDVPADAYAYLMYTSGSTGKPKGVLIDHTALATYCAADQQVYQLVPEDRTLQFSTLSFDIAVEEIFPPLLVGSCVVVRPRSRSDEENELLALINQHQITALHLATAYWHEWVDLLHASGQRVPRSLRMVLATGEKVSPVHYQRWIDLSDHRILWCNAYGPTEATVTATVFIPEPGWQGESMPIGKPLPGYQAVILDDASRPLSVGETGELYLGGPALARGYLHQPDKTAAAFRFVDLPDQGEVRLYKTGDLARWLPDGNIEFAGRVDHQIKLGSFRIEPGEIEYQITRHPRVLEALVCCETIDQQKTLIAFAATGSESLTAAELADFLRAQLPCYMVPSRYCFCDQFPKTVNGKIDRRALPASDHWESPRQNSVVAPRNPIESLLVNIWAEVLGIAKISVHDDFFALGGSSLLVTRVITKIREHYQLSIPVRDFFANPTVESIAALLAKRLGVVTEVQQDHAKNLRASQPRIEPFFFTSANRQLFAVRYPAMPSGADAGAAALGVVFCHAEGHEYARAHRNVQQLSLQLAKAGVDTLRFDYAGTGNSSGSPDQVDLLQWRENICDAVSEMRRRADVSRVAVVGVRLGATLAANSQLREVDQLILWDPVFSGKLYLNLLGDLHQRALRGGHYYQRTRRTNSLQRFGTMLSPDKHAQLTQLVLPDQQAIPTTVIASQGYLAAEGAGWESTGIDLVETEDAIFWQRPEYTESAFSAPGVARAILRLLTERE